MVKTLLSKSEIIKFLNLSSSFVFEFSEHDILSKEIAVFRHFDKYEFYKKLLSNLKDKNTADWENGKTYNTGDEVIHCDICYSAKKDGVISETSVIAEWGGCSAKFIGDCKNIYAEIWENALGRYLALEVLRSKIPLLISQITTSGVISFSGNNFDVSKDKDSLYHTINQLIKESKDNFLFLIDEYNKQNKDSDCFLEFKKDENCGCDGKNTSYSETSDYVRFG